jgi:hypothetical protein
MKLRFKEVNVRFAQGTSEIRKIVGEWEIPLLEAIHEAVLNVGDIIVERDALSVSAEMERLKKIYGEERNDEGLLTGTSLVEAVYGKHAIGIRALKDIMQSAVVANNTPVTPLEVSPPMRNDLLQAISGTDTGVSDLIGAPDDEVDEVEVDEVEAA